ncbi:FadR/GntR family transcriptional regulator [Ideonella livida]|uniref:Pyruvate dehydrogenase complex repressor n=1 Tax=Ideonella livida TaxID=2707176 RepID=A0A7C9TK18_9BURK|nr:FCD domain-containing protein [Ideonella livida]NDY91343.1 FadR family transcriptional regulator [Ideonella livida]
MKHHLHARVSDGLATRLEREIVREGRWKPGERLPAEREWAQTLGVSRGALREALGQLAERGLVQRRHGSGTWVSDQPDARKGDPWAQLLQRQPLMQGDLLEFREMLEIRCAELAAQRADASDRARLTERLAAVDAAYAGADRQAQVQADVAFHRALADATHNPVFGYLVATLLDLLHQHVHLSIADLAPRSDEAQALCRQHGALCAAVLAADAPAAAQAAGEHIHFVRQRWRQRLD